MGRPDPECNRRTSLLRDFLCPEMSLIKLYG